MPITAYVTTQLYWFWPFQKISLYIILEVNTRIMKKVKNFVALPGN